MFHFLKNILNSGVRYSNKTYFELIKDLPRPTDHQTESFIHDFSLAHSWYKHLSFDKPTQFVFYLDPNAGRTFFKKRGNYSTFINKEEDQNAKIYQSGFGHWNYYTTKYTINYIPDEGGNVRDSKTFIGLAIIDSEGLSLPLAEDVLEMCSIGVTGFLHGSFANSKDICRLIEGHSNKAMHIELMAKIRSHLHSLLQKFY